MPAAHVIHPGDRFGKLTAISKDQYLSTDGKKRWKWTSRCDCGELVGPTAPAHLVKKIRSCKKCGYVDRGVKSRISGTHLAARAKYNEYRHNAKSRGLDFQLDFDTFFSLTQDICFYCGSAPSNIKRMSDTPWAEDFYYNGLDRIDSREGYLPDNVQPCCWVCNYMKRDKSSTDFLRHVRRIAEYRDSRNTQTAR